MTETGLRHQPLDPVPLRSSQPAAQLPPPKLNRATQLLRITSAIADAVSSEAVHTALVDHVYEAMQASSVGLWIADHDRGTTSLVRARGYHDGAQQKFDSVRLDAAQSFPALDCMRRADPIWIRSQTDMLSRYPHLRDYATPGRDYRISVLPLVSRARVLGALGITIENNVAPDAEEQEFLRLIARYASQAVERLRMLESERRSRQAADAAAARAQQLYHFADAVAAAFDITTVFEAALTSIETAVGASRSAILTYGNDPSMRFRAWHHLSDDYRRAVDGHSPWTRESTDIRPVLVSDAAADDNLRAYRTIFASEGIRALAFIPLVNDKRLLGKFMVYFGEPHVFTEQEIATATAVANHLASVLVRFEMVSRLEDTVKQNELFSGVLAHDLRNPLDAIVSAAQLALVQHDVTGAAERAPLAQIVNSGFRMSTMISQLLDLTRVRSGGGIGIAVENTDLATICSNAIAELSLSHPEWRIQFTNIGTSMGRWDANRLHQMLSNLIANAGQHGSATDGIRTELDGSQAAQIRLTVSNAGAIDPELVPVMFDPFRRARVRTRHPSGLGLGLFIVREIVRAHDGTIDVDSSEVGGTRIAVTLPRGL